MNRQNTVSQRELRRVFLQRAAALHPHRECVAVARRHAWHCVGSKGHPATCCRGREPEAGAADFRVPVLREEETAA